jgi:cyclic pyranopterin phosphate synthase
LEDRRMGLTHTDESGKARMVDVSEKEITTREATARGRITMKPETLAMIRENRIKKGDVLSTARIAAIMAAKRTPDLIPLCHPIPISDVSVDLILDERAPGVEITVTVSAVWRTGVEMEAIVGVVAAAATIYDMIKAVDRAALITDVGLSRKSGGKSGTYIRET